MEYQGIRDDAAARPHRLRKIKLFVFFAFIALTAVLAVNAFSPKVVGEEVREQTEDTGAELFQTNCARCHGTDGTGGKGPNLASEKRQAKWKDSDAKIVKKITKGGLFMPSFGKKLKPEEIKAIAEHVRTLKQ